MSTVKVNRIENTSTSSGGLDVDGSGNVIISEARVTTLTDSAGNNASTPAEITSGRAKAWVNFNGTGTVAISASYNVSSITDNGTGDYTVNFTTAISDANYTVFAGCLMGTNTTINEAFGVKGNAPSSSITAPALKSTTAVQVMKQGATGGELDDPDLSVIVFR